MIQQCALERVLVWDPILVLVTMDIMVVLVNSITRHVTSRF